MNKAVLIISLILSAIIRPFLISAQPNFPETTAPQLDSTLTWLHQRGLFNGVVLIVENGKTIYSKALSSTNLNAQEPLKTTSSFNLASVSKQFVAMQVMQLHDQGKLEFDDKVQKHLPDFPYPDITIRQLLTHTSGLPEYFDLVQKYTTTLDTLTNDGILELLSIHRPTLEFAPGARWEYCNTGYLMLALVIEKVAGMPIEVFFKQQIIEPLGLRDTYMYSLKMKQSPRNRVYGFARENGRKVLNDLIRVDGVIGDGNVYASAADLLVWDQALLSQKLAKAATWQEATTPVRLNDGSTYNYGFGLSIGDGGKILSHTGSWVGFYTLIVRYLNQKKTLIVLTNGTNPEAPGIVRNILEGKPITLPSFQIITNASLLDGTGTPARPASVRLRGNEIWEIGELTPFPNEPVTDARGLILAPGFIDSHSHHFGSLEEAPEALSAVSQGITTIITGQDGGSIPVDSIEAFIEKRPIAINVGTYTGHSTLRHQTMGANLFRTAKPEEVEKMKVALVGELVKGSFGLSTGLEYEAAFFSNRDEVLKLAKVTAAAGGRYMSHIRSEDLQLDEAIDEIIEIGREAKLPVQISHIKIADRERWNSAPQLLARLQAARSQGIDITADCYPYDYWSSTLRVLFPKRDYTNLASAEMAVRQLFDPAGSVVVHYAADTSYAGKTVTAIADLRHETPAQTLMALVANAAYFSAKNPDYTGSVEGIMGKSMAEADVARLLTWPHTNICSDGSAGGHPRGYGTFTRVLGRYVREQKLMPLETAIYKMTGLTAEHLGLTDRGLIKNGYQADLVLFDPATVQDNASIQDSRALSTGIEKVWVNGDAVYQSGQATGKLPGKFIQKSR